MVLWSLPVVLFAVLALAVPLVVVYGAVMTATRRLWSGSDLVAPLFGLLGTAAVFWAAFLAYLAQPVVGVVVSALLLAAALVVLLAGGLWREWRRAVPVLALGVAAVVFYLGFSYLWGNSGGVYNVVPERFFAFRLPADNLIPGLFAQKILADESTHMMIGDWNGGDRPPLQSGFALLVRPIIGLAQLITGHSVTDAVPEPLAFAADMLPQLLWLPVAFVLLRMLSFGRAATLAGLAFAIVIPAVMVNTVFTWPKMLSAALVLAALAFLLAARSTPHRFGLYFASAIIAAVFGLLAHGAAAFTVPALILVGLYALWNRPWRRSAAAIGAGIGIGVVLYLPWLVYQRLIDPPGDRLLKWHFAGVTAVDPRSFLETLVDQYGKNSLGTSIGNRLQNLSTVFGADQFRQLSDRKVGFVTFLRIEDWTSTLFAVGLIGSLLLVMMTAGLLVRRRQLTAVELPRLLMLGGMLVSVLVWALLLFTPNQAIVPHGSHAWILVFTMLPFAWLTERRPRLALVLLGLQALSCILVYSIDLLPPFTPLSRVAAVVAVVGVLGVLAVPVLAVRSDRRAALQDAAGSVAGASRRT